MTAAHPTYDTPPTARVPNPPAAPAPAAFTGPRRLLGLLTSAERKEYPVTTGFLDYFPDATAMVAHISFLGNQKHNPGQPLGWSRDKSSDHADCMGRHTIERGSKDTEGVIHSAQNAWRAMAELQIELEKEFKLDPPRGAK